MNTITDKEAGTAALNDGGVLPEELAALGGEIVELIYRLVASPGAYADEAAVCRAFSELLLRHWEICCITIFLRDDSDDGHLRECYRHTDEHLDTDEAKRAAALLADALEREGCEQRVWLDDDETDAGDAERKGDGKTRRSLMAARAEAGIALPITARGALVGGLVVIAHDGQRLRQIVPGIRLLSAPIVITLDNARRAAALNVQRQRNDQLVEELRARGAALEDANRELQRIGRYRSLFLARMSHELRTPLTSMLGFSEILLEHEDLSPTQRRFCEKIQASGKQLHTSLNQLVDLSRLEAGQTELFLHEFSARETMREACGAVIRLAQKQEVTLDCETAPDAGTIVSDEGKLRQVLYNFLAHAISRSPPAARVTVRAGVSASDTFSIEIRDEGEPLEDAAHVFDPVDVDAPSESGTNLNELGLVIAHRLVGALRGTVALDHQLPRGLTVRLEFPARPTE